MNIYDFDGTLYPKDSSVRFCLFCLRRTFAAWQFFPKFIYTTILYLCNLTTKETWKSTFFGFIPYLSNTENLVCEFWKEEKKYLQLNIFPVDTNRNCVISASPYFLLKPIVSDELHWDLIASDVSPQTGKFLAKNCSGEEKVHRFLRMFPKEKINYFFSDSFSDQPLANLAAHPFFVQKGTCIPWHERHLSKFEKLMQHFMDRKFLLFLFCGGSGTLFNFAVSLFSAQYVNPSLAYLIGYSASLFVTFYLTANLVFHQPMAMERFFKFVVSYIPNFLIQMILVLLFLKLWNLPPLLVYALATLLGLPITFLLLKLFAFKKRNRQ